VSGFAAKGTGKKLSGTHPPERHKTLLESFLEAEQ